MAKTYIQRAYDARYKEVHDQLRADLKRAERDRKLAATVSPYLQQRPFHDVPCVGDGDKQ